MPSAVDTPLDAAAAGSDHAAADAANSNASGIIRRVQFTLDEDSAPAPTSTDPHGRNASAPPSLDSYVPRRSSSPTREQRTPTPTGAKRKAPPQDVASEGGHNTCTVPAKRRAVEAVVDDEGDGGDVGGGNSDGASSDSASDSDDEDDAALLAGWKAGVAEEDSVGGEDGGVGDEDSGAAEDAADVEEGGGDGEAADVDAAPALRDPPRLVPLAEIAAPRRKNIEDAAREIYGIEQMRGFQIEGAYHAAYNNDTYLVVNRATADGKSLIPKVVNALRGGVGVNMVPLIGLGSDQVDKAVVVEHNVEPYHIDEHKSSNATALKQRLLGLTDEEKRHVVIQLFLGPRAFASPYWQDVLKTLSKRGHIAYFCIDEAHEVEQSGRFFRQEFKTATATIPSLLKLMPRPVPRIVMSATLTKRDEDTVTALLGDMKPNVLDGALTRRDVKITVDVTGDPAASLKRSADLDMRDSMDHQQIWYTNSRTNAEGGLLEAAEKLLATHKREAIAHSFTGSDGIMMKTTTMDAIARYEELTGEGTVLEPTEWKQSGLATAVALPKIQILVATKSAQAGIDGMWIKFSKKKGLPSSLYELVQEMGRVNRSRLAPAGSNTYEVHISYDSYISTYIRIMQCDDDAERKTQLKHLHQVLQLLVAPTRCYHEAIEHFFERSPVERGPCGQLCSYCLEEVGEFTKRVKKNGLVSFLTTKVFGTLATPTPKAFKNAMKANKAHIFHPEDVPKQSAGQIHALALQLLANEIIGFCVTDTTKRGTAELREKHVGVELLKKKVDGVMLPSYMINSSWDGIRIVDGPVV